MLLHDPKSAGLRPSSCPRIAAIMLLCAALFAACSSSTRGVSSSTSTIIVPATSSKLVIEETSNPEVSGDFLVNSYGQTLYMFAPDQQKRVSCNALCRGSWPLESVCSASTLRAGAGVQSRLLGTLKADGLRPGCRAVTYNGWPLYVYQDDVTSGMTSGQGVDLNGGYWYLMQPDGTPLVPAGDPLP